MNDRVWPNRDSKISGRVRSIFYFTEMVSCEIPVDREASSPRELRGGNLKMR